MPAFGGGGDVAVPVRVDGRVAFIGGFYAQWEWQVTQLDHVSVEFLQQILATEVVSLNGPRSDAIRDTWARTSPARTTWSVRRRSGR